MKSIKPIHTGDEILNDYGSLPRSDLLRMYGYITNNYAQYDVVEVSYELLVKVAKDCFPEVEVDSWQKLEDTAEEYDLVEEGYIISRSTPSMKLENAITGQLHMLLRILCGGTCKRYDWSSNNSKFAFTSREANLLAAVMARRLNEYPTTLAQDQQLIKDLHLQQSAPVPPSAVTDRYEMAVQVRKGEKEICHSVLQMCQEFLQLSPKATNPTIKRQRDGDDGPPKKSRKAAWMGKKVKR
jgi:N-lysine methyltransferase SETD6